MTIVFASNSIADFVGAGISTDSTDRRTAYVSRSFLQQGSGNKRDVIARTKIPTVAGDITWIHFQYVKTRDFDNFSSDGDAVLALYGPNNVKILDFDLLDGNMKIRLFGSSTLTVGITGDMDGTNVTMAVDIEIDLTSDISVEMFVDGVSKYNQSQAWSSSPGNPVDIYWRTWDATDFGTLTQYISELIVADESTIGMGLSEMTPNAAGIYTQWQGDHAATGDSDTGTGASSDAAGQRLSSDLSSIIGPASSALRALVVNTKASIRGGTVTGLRNFLRISSTNYLGAAMGVDGDIKSHTTVWDINPDTVADWDTTDFAGVEIGVEGLPANMHLAAGADQVLARDSSVPGSTHSLGSLDVGASDTDKNITLVLTSKDDASRAITALTIGSVSLVERFSEASGGSPDVKCYQFSGDISSLSGVQDIDVTFDGSVDSVSVSCHVWTDMISIVPTSSAVDSTTVGGDLTMSSLTAVAGGIMYGVTAAELLNSGNTWTVQSENVDSGTGAQSDDHRHSMALDFGPLSGAVEITNSSDSKAAIIVTYR